MNKKKIWVLSFVLGLLTTFVVYFGFFSNFSSLTSNAGSEVADAAKVVDEQVDEKTSVSERNMNNPMLEISEGNRAISLKSQLEQGVSGYIEPGSYVDIMAYETTKDNATGKEYKSADLVLQNKKVLASGKSSDSAEEALLYETVTVEVTPQEGVVLGLAAKDKDGFYFMLRNKDDHGIQQESIKQTREVIKDGAE